MAHEPARWLGHDYIEAGIDNNQRRLTGPVVSKIVQQVEKMTRLSNGYDAHAPRLGSPARKHPVAERYRPLPRCRGHARLFPAPQHPTVDTLWSSLREGLSPVTETAKLGATRPATTADLRQARLGPTSPGPL